jgi:hypothetical protein
MRYVLRIGLFLVQVLVFVVVAGSASTAFSEINATTFRPGEPPPLRFPIVALAPLDPASKSPRYQLVRWGELEELRRKQSGMSFKLDQAEGRFTRPKQGDFEPQVAFKVLERSPKGLLVEVASYDDDYELVGRYLTDGRSIEPRYFRSSGVVSSLAGIVPGLIVAWLLGRVVRRRWLKDPAIPGGHS